MLKGDVLNIAVDAGSSIDFNGLKERGVAGDSPDSAPSLHMYLLTPSGETFPGRHGVVIE